ncbi:DUF4360 domain-containing protein [Dolichospermum sp. ST_con]|nr:DUF4360 domain-containing protein [Dolichospermum sp. ST_con]MDD1420770.1 DUF4360 domain-containing protein [Dolichospermum sp. ST_sed1]MDD1424349.1 DUF4360 domain-containing protein [Dolichospermum sp. ST_sed9]MDD1430795.1 DUF4360 domain-containing protein [Dolichospermum sp. ST_sed6]MDD1443951.1 DUF4360 domain-containing protein [Dolichospermum sp. ST_sed3]MDD1446184.1 DUF4360 domain-containing protein [Dolichospermum sp. ST_sed8]MDD1456429.1 DUF4360 domain-containing protein [Dolichospe
MNNKNFKRWQTFVLTPAVLLSLTLPHQSFAQEAAPGSVKITDFTFGGNGCPERSVGSLISNNRSTIELLFDKFIVELPSKRYPQQSACTVSFKLEYPKGWSATLHKVQHRGFADTSGGATGEIRSKYYIPGEGGVEKTQVYQIPAGKTEDYKVETDLLSTAYTPCNTMNVPMSVNTRIRLSGGDGQKFNTLTVDSISQKVKTILNFKWKKCPNP